MNYITKFIKSLKNSNVLIDGIAETVQYEIKKKKKKRWNSSYFVCTFGWFKPVNSSVVKGTSRKGVTRAGIRYMDKIF